MKVFSAILILSVLCITSKAQHFCESLVQNNYKVMFHKTDWDSQFNYWEQGILVVGDKYWPIIATSGLNKPFNVTFKPDQPMGSSGLFKDYSLIFDTLLPNSSDGYYNPTKKTMDYIKFNVSTNAVVFERQGIVANDPSHLLDNTTFTMHIPSHIQNLYVLVAHSPNSVDDSLVSTYIEAHVYWTDPSNTTLNIDFKSDNYRNYTQTFEYYSTKGYRLMGNANRAMIHQKKGSFVYCQLTKCNEGLKQEKPLIDCDALGFTAMTTISTETDTLSNGVVSDLSTPSNGNTAVGDSPQVSTELGSDSENGDLMTSTQSKGEGDATRTPGQSNVSPGTSVSFGLDLWLILLIIFIIVAVIAVLVVSIVWFRSQSSEQKSEDGSKADAPKSQIASKTTADGKNQSEVVSVRSE